tara:strand:- start:278 stop:487 length:210 start_codon:yes stop_codon:yes gene_type:complete
MNKLTHFQKTILAEAIYSHLTKLHDNTLEYQEKYPDKNLLIGPKFYTQERDEILRKLKLDFVLCHEWLL